MSSSAARRWRQSLATQLRQNAVALISLVIALTSLGYNTWRNETTEAHRNVRTAAFQTLEQLAGLQSAVLHQAYVAPSSMAAVEASRLRIDGYARVQLIQDIMQLMPPPGPQAGDELFQLWDGNVNALQQGAGSPAAQQALGQLNQRIDETRLAVRQVLAELD